MSAKYPILYKSSRKPARKMTFDEWDEAILDYRVRRTLLGFIFWALV